jgi:hypothetical protein
MDLKQKVAVVTGGSGAIDRHDGDVTSRARFPTFLSP